MEMVTTWWLLGIGLGVAAVSLLGDRARRRAPLAWHAYLPWNGLVFAGLAAALFAGVHLLGLLRAG